MSAVFPYNAPIPSAPANMPGEESLPPHKPGAKSLNHLMDSRRRGYDADFDHVFPTKSSRGRMRSPERRKSEDASGVPSLTVEELYRYRYQYGVNLGSVFVLERWLFRSMFDEGAAGDSELDAVQASIAKRGLPATIQKWEKHWSSALTNDDIEYMMTARCNMVRLPIGYYTLGPDCCVGTPFEGDAAEVYKNAWKHVLDICGKLRAAGIGVLIDLHAAPGGANGDSHSGTSSSKAALWGNKANLALSRRCHVFIAQEVAAGKIPNCIGLELCNESAHGAKDLYKFYDEAIRAVAAVDSTLPVYVSDAWDLAKAVQWAAKHNAAFRDLNPVVVDTHTYYTFAAADRACAPQTILDRIPGEFARAAPAPADVLAHGATPLFVGEYSCVLDGQTWARAPAAQRDDYVRQLGTLQLERAFARALGAAFWTLKMEWMDGGEWGFVAMTKAGAIGAPELGWLAAVDVEDRAVEVRADKAAARADALARFRVQCQRECPKRSWAPALFTAGFAAGWEDALAFWDGRRRFCLVAAGSAVGEAIGADKIGDLDAWILKRLRDVGPATGTWEWERGFRVAVDGAEDRLLRAMSSCASSRSTLFQNK